ncbi:MAG: SidA/IucD/PvdA family monooxygenase, partial [Chitinophagaceae bacterium]|nr:SidA/IucD/PvdA family monooxygenase [Chitinophagaceae bacterium]
AMEYSKMVLEMTSPDYLKYFYSLPKEAKGQIIQRQKTLYKGINEDLVQQIYELLYHKLCEDNLPKVRIMANCRLKKIANASYGLYNLHFQELYQQKGFILETKSVILATGYKTGIPAVLENANLGIKVDSSGDLVVSKQYAVNDENSIYVQNAELHTHGFIAPDLAMGPFRNCTIINSILGARYYDTRQMKMFQDFGLSIF